MQSIWKCGQLITLQDKTCTPEQERQYAERYRELMAKSHAAMLDADYLNTAASAMKAVGDLVREARSKYNLVLGADAPQEEWPLPGETPPWRR